MLLVYVLPEQVIMEARLVEKVGYIFMPKLIFGYLYLLHNMCLGVWGSGFGTKEGN